MPSQFEGHEVVFAKPEKDVWAVDYFDRLIPAEGLSIRGLNHRHVREGIGVPFVGWRENLGREPIESHFPPEGITRPVTATVAARSDGTRGVTLWNPAKRDRVNGFQLAADFTAPWAFLLAKTKPLKTTGLRGLLNAGKIKRPPRIWLMEPYDPQKSVLLMVHGLLSTPLAWMDVTNDLRADQEVRRRYQIWHFHYPTGLPFLYSAKVLRDEYARVRNLLDPQQRDPAMQKTVVVAHSMGGLLSKTLITDSGECVWPIVLTRPPREFKTTADDLQTLESIFYWRGRPEVRRVIFIAVPHHGSRMAIDWVGRAGDLLAVVPDDFRGLYRRLNESNPDSLHGPLAGSLLRGRLTAIDTLSPRHPVLPVLNALPLSHGAETHSIIGNKNPAGPIEESTDGVVPYTSSHFPSAASEVVVDSGHDAFRPPEALQEIRRILLLAPPTKRNAE